MAGQETKILYHKILHRNEQKTTKKIVNLQSNFLCNFCTYIHKDFERITLHL